jgi:pentatricopeptide repeat domain-containing protein 1
VYEVMAATGIAPNTHTCSALITACERGGQWQRAVRVCEDMTKAGVVANTVTCNAMIRAYGRGGQWREATKVAD